MDVCILQPGKGINSIQNAMRQASKTTAIMPMGIFIPIPIDAFPRTPYIGKHDLRCRGKY